MGLNRVSRAWQGSWLALTVAFGMPALASAQAPEPDAADEPPPERSVITPFETPSTPARVVRQPSYEEGSAYYPQAAQGRNVGGKAVVACEMAPSQRLVNCVLTEESPKGFGFGAALLKMAQLYRVAPPTYDDKVVEGETFTLTMSFAPSAAAPRPAPPVDDAATAGGPVPSVEAAEPAPAKQETPEERLKRLGPLKRSDGVLWAPIGFAIVVLAGLGRALMPMRRGRRVPRPADQRA